MTPDTLAYRSHRAVAHRASPARHNLEGLGPLRASIVAIFLVATILTMAQPGRAASDWQRTIISPRATDPAIDSWPNSHYAYAPKASLRKGKLFLFLPGSFGKPANQQLVMEEAARLGLHGINLSYPNSWTVASLCRRDVDLGCFEKVRLEIVDGIDRTPLVDIDQANSIENRLAKLLAYLEQEKTGEGWGAFLGTDGKPIWSSIRLAGHSQGGAHAAILGQLHAVDRVVAFGAPNDFNVRFQVTAPWLSGASKTPPERIFGFNHRLDSWEARLLAWEAQGLGAFGSPTSVDGTVPPFGGSHQLFTEATPARSGGEHGSVVVDKNTPLDANGEPLFRPVWRFLLDGEADPPPAPPQPPPSPEPLRLNGERFEVRATFRLSGGEEGNGQPVPLTEDTGYFWFFAPDNVELVVKVLNGCGINGRFWVFAGGLTNVEVEITVTDTATGRTEHYTNPLSTPFQPIQDTTTGFSC